MLGRDLPTTANTPFFLLPLTLSQGLNNYIDDKAENFCGFALHLCQQMYVCKYDRSSSTQRCGWLSNKWSVFIFSTGTERKKFLWLIFYSVSSKLGNLTKNTRIGIYIMFTTLRKLQTKKGGSADRQRIAATYFRRRIWKGRRQMLWYLYNYSIHARSPPLTLHILWTLRNLVRWQR